MRTQLTSVLLIMVASVTIASGCKSVEDTIPAPSDRESALSVPTIGSTTYRSQVADRLPIGEIYCADEIHPMTGLRRAAAEGDLHSIRQLIHRASNIINSSNVCQISNNGRLICQLTPLHLAVRSGSIEAVNALLKAGAKVDASVSYWTEILSSITNRERYLIAITCISEMGTPLSSAASDYLLDKAIDGDGHFVPLKNRKALQVNMIEVLLLAGADPDGGINKESAWPCGHSPLPKVARMGNLAGVRLFLKHGADVNARNCGGFTALRWAIHWRRYEVVRELLDAGADICAKDSGGISDLEYARIGGYPRMMEFLRTHTRSSRNC